MCPISYFSDNLRESEQAIRKALDFADPSCKRFLQLCKDSLQFHKMNRIIKLLNINLFAYLAQNMPYQMQQLDYFPSVGKNAKN